MDINIILKQNLQQKQMNIFHHIFQYFQYCRLKKKKISMTYTEVNNVRKSFVNAYKSTQRI